MKAMIFTEQSLYRCINNSLYEDILSGKIDKEDVFSIIMDDFLFILSTGVKDKDLLKEGLIVLYLDKIDLNKIDIFEKLQSFFLRIHRVAFQSKRKNSAYSHSWMSYHYDNKVALFAFPENLGKNRIIIETNISSGNNIIVYELDNGKTKVLLQNYKFDHKIYDHIISITKDIETAASKICETKKID